MSVLAADLDGVALRPLEDILKYSMSAYYVYDFSCVLLGHSTECCISANDWFTWWMPPLLSSK